MKNDDQETKDHKALSQLSLVVRVILILVISIGTISYILSLINGGIPRANKIDWVAFALIVFSVMCVVLLVTPDIFDRLKLFEVQGFKVEMLEKVKEKQAYQESRLDDILLVMPLLLQPAERKHLLNLDTGKTKYVGGHVVRTELRSLRAAGLIFSRPNNPIAILEDKKEIDISTLVGLTPLGKRWAQRINELEKVEKAE